MSLALESVGVRQGDATILRDISLTLERGTINVLLGPTLAGKTTLMRLMAGLDRPTTGRILLDGRDMAGVPVRGRSVAMVYQQFVNYPSLTVYENIASPLRVSRVPKAEIDRRVREAAAVLRLEPMLGRLPAQLSGGQQQRTAIARALVKRAALVLLDEPLANLDYKLREELREELPRLFGATGAILVYATTEPAEALLLRGTTATLSEGRLTQHGPSAAVYRAPAGLESARVFSDPPLNEAAIERRGAEVTLPDGRRLPAAGVLARVPEGRHRLGFRVEAARLDAATAGPLRVPGRVSVTEISGSESFVHVDVGFATWVCLVAGVHEWRPGVEATVQLDPDALFVFDDDGRTVASPVGTTPAPAVPVTA
ncbi:MAG: ABC transporter ATP-binding protein [Janthinobacterium lividum]